MTLSDLISITIMVVLHNIKELHITLTSAMTAMVVILSATIYNAASKEKSPKEVIAENTNILIINKLII